MTALFGPTFGAELIAAGCQDGISWNSDGIITDPSTITAAQRAVIAAHDPTKVDLRPTAQVALDKSDTTVLRCYSAGVAVPAAWQTYRSDLRAIFTGTDKTSTALPAAPAYPAGT